MKRACAYYLHWKFLVKTFSWKCTVKRWGCALLTYLPLCKNVHSLVTWRKGSMEISLQWINSNLCYFKYSGHRFLVQRVETSSRSLFQWKRKCLVCCFDHDESRYVECPKAAVNILIRSLVFEKKLWFYKEYNYVLTSFKNEFHTSSLIDDICRRFYSSLWMNKIELHTYIFLKITVCRRKEKLPAGI